MKKTAFITCCLLLFICCISKAQTATIFRGGTFYQTYTTMKQALDSCKNGDSIILSAHTFYERKMTLTKSVILQGTIASGDTSLIDAQNLDYILRFAGSGGSLTIRNIILAHGRISGPGSGGAALSTGTSDTVHICGNSIIRDNTAENGAIGAGIAVSECTLSDNVLITGNHITNTIPLSSGLLIGAGVYAGNITIKDSVRITDNNITGTLPATFTGTIAGAGLHAVNFIIKDKARISGNEIAVAAPNASFIGGGGLFTNGNSVLEGNVEISNNSADHGGGIALNGTLTIGTHVNIHHNTADTGGAMYIDNLILTGVPVLNMTGGQIANNTALMAAAIYNEGTVNIAHARVFNPAVTGKHANEVYNSATGKFYSDSTWWGEGDTTGLFVNKPGATFKLNSWVKANWSMNGGAPVTGLTTFPIVAAFKLNSGTSLNPASLSMLEGNFSASSGSFSLPTAPMSISNDITSVYTGPVTSGSTVITAIVDADTFKYSGPVTGTSVHEVYAIDGIKAYPNPVKDIIHVEAPEGSAATLYNIIGQSVLGLEPGHSIAQLDIQHLPKGNYFLQITDNKGTKGTMKIVKE